MSPCETLERPGLTVRLIENANVVVAFEGVVREPTPEEWLSPLLKRATILVESKKGDAITLDLRALTYMNASAFRAVVALLRDLTNRHEDWKLHVWSNPAHMWQRVAIASLKSLGGQSVLVDERP